MSEMQSYVHGVSDTPLLGLTVGACFEAAVTGHPDGEALVVPHQDVRWSYHELQEEVDAFAAGLVALGLKPGERVGIWAPNCAEWVVTQFATAKAGLILVNINPAYRLPELDYALTKVGCSALITAAAFKSSDYVQMLNELIPELGASKPGALQQCQAAGAPDRHTPGRRQNRRHAELCGYSRACRRGGKGGGAADFRRTAVRRSDQHSVHQRDDGRAEGGSAHPSQHRQQCLLRRPPDGARAG